MLIQSTPFVPSAIFEMVFNQAEGHTPGERILATFPELQTKDGVLAVLNAPEGKTQFVENKTIIYKWLQKMAERQTASERNSYTTVVNNGVGFSALDAAFLTSVADNSHRYSGLTPKQTTSVAKCLKRYSRQLIEIAKNGA